MGGSRSGRQRARPVLRERLRLDVLQMRRYLGTETTGAVLQWRNGSRVEIRARHDAVWLRYAIGSQSVSDMVPVVSLPCYFGGTRALFRCNGCQRLARVLYLHPARFVCRQCTGLRYWSQSVSSRTRAQVAIHRVQKLLAPHDDFGSWSPDGVPDERPKGMRRRTHQRLLERLQVLQERWESWSDYELSRSGFGFLERYLR
jgi:hypothetical protein